MDVTVPDLVKFNLVHWRIRQGHKEKRACR